MEKTFLKGSLFFGIVLMVLPRLSSGSWVNPLGGMLSRSCMYGYAISGFQADYSTGSSDKKDRLWDIRCSKISYTEDDTCRWTFHFVNSWRQNLNYRCEKHAYVSGMYSDYKPTKFDRRWRIECCKSRGVRLENCIDTDFVNNYNGRLEFYLPDSKALHGMSSVFDARKGDRKWKFHICDIVRV